MKFQVKKAVFPVAGLGTRFLPATKAMPKELLPIIDKPVVQFVVEEAIEAGIRDLIFITGRTKRAIEDQRPQQPPRPHDAVEAAPAGRLGRAPADVELGQLLGQQPQQGPLSYPYRTVTRVTATSA